MNSLLKKVIFNSAKPYPYGSVCKSGVCSPFDPTKPSVPNDDADEEDEDDDDNVNVTEPEVK